MAQTDELFEVIRDYAGQDGETQFIPVIKGEIVHVIKKEIEYYTIEKNNLIGKVPMEYLRSYKGEQSTSQDHICQTSVNGQNQDNESLHSKSKHGNETQEFDNISVVAYSYHSKQYQQSQQSLLSKFKQRTESKTTDNLADSVYAPHSKKTQQSQQSLHSRSKSGNETKATDNSTYAIYSINYKNSQKSQQSLSSIQSVLSVNTSASSWHNLLFEIPRFEDFDIMKKLSGGAMGKTFLVQLKLTGKQYVMKRVEYLDDKDIKRADQEVAIMQKLSSRYTVRLIWAFVDRFELFMITDYCELGDLKKIIKDLQLLPEEERLNRVWALFAQIIKAVDFMHSLGIIHRDIKPANIFIMEDGTARLGDFGLAKEISKDGFATVAGTLNYQAAEVWTLGKMYFSSDLFAVGVCIYELITGQNPFAAQSQQEMIEKIKKGQFKPLPSWVPIELKDIITAMLNPNQNQRPSTQIIIEIEQIKRKINIFEESYNQKDLDRNKKYQQTLLLEIQPITIQQLIEIKEEINQPQKDKLTSQSLFEMLTNALRAIRSVQANEQSEITEEMTSISKEITNQIIEITRQNIDKEKYINQSIKTGFVCEFINLISRTPTNEIKQEMIQIIEIISQKGTSKHVQKMFYMNAIFSLTAFLKNTNQQNQKSILQIFLNIIRNGWNRIKQSQLQQLSTIEEIDQQQKNQSKHFNYSNLSQKSNSQLSQHSNSSQHSYSSQGSQLSIKISQSQVIRQSSEQSQSHLQKLLLFQHPYQTILEKQNVILFFIEEILLDNEYNIENKEKACEILDILYIQGIKFNKVYTPQIISSFCQSTKSNDKNTKSHALKALAYLAVNKKNNQSILDEDILDILSKEFKSVNECDNQDIIRNSLIILQFLYINGSKYAKLEINKILTSELLEQLMNNQYYGSEGKIIQSTLNDPNIVEQLMRIRRSINNKNEEYLDELFIAGLTIVLNEEIVKIMIKEDNEEGLLIILGQIQQMIPQNTIETYRLTFNESDFINQQLYNLNSLDVSEVKVEQLDILLLISEKFSPIQNQRLFSKEMIQTIIRIFKSEDKDIINKANKIISNFIEKGMNELNEGEQHPKRQQLMTNEILIDINSLLKDKNKKNIHYLVAQIIANLYKAYPLPPEMQIKVIHELQYKKDYSKLSLLDECSENRKIIIENKIFEFIKKTLDYFHLTLKQLKYYNVDNRIEIALFAQQQIMKLITIENLQKIGKSKKQFDNDRKEIQLKGQQLLIIIKEFENNYLLNYLSSNKPLNLKRISTISKLIDCMNENYKPDINIFKNIVIIIQYLQTTSQQQKQATNKIKIICINIIQKIIFIINFLTIKNQNDVELLFQSGLIIQLVELIKQTQIDPITENLIKPFETICKQGSAKQIHQLYLMGMFQILSPKLKNKDKVIQRSILSTFNYIIQKGWQQIQQSEYSSSSQSEIQQLLDPSLPHPYQEQLEQQQIINTIIQEVILSNESSMENKTISCQLLDNFYFEGIKQPINLKLQAIKYFCDYAKSNDDTIRQYALQSLSYLAINQDNHDLIISEEVIIKAVEYIMKELEVKDNYSVNIKYSLPLIINLFLFGSQQTQQLIQYQISKETLNKLKNITYYWDRWNYQDEIKQLISSYSDPNTMNELIRLRRVVERRNEEGLIELIKAGLIIRIIEIIEKSIQETDGEGKIIIIGKIIQLLIKNNSEVNKMIFEQTNFIEQYIQILNSIPLPQIKSGYLKPLYYLSQYIQIEYQNKLFEKRVVQLMNKIIDSEEYGVKENSTQIIKEIIKAELDGLTEGQQHSYHQQLQSDGTIPKLIQVFKDEKDKYIQKLIAQTFAYLFKALPLPPEIRNNVIDQLKLNNDFEELSIIAECPDNQDTIFFYVLEMKLFENDEYTIEQIKFSLSILKYGSSINKLRVCFFIKEKVEQLADDEYVDQLGNECKNNWNSDKKQEIKSKAKELFQLIISIINDKNNINLISQLAAKIQDSKDKDDRQYLCEIILNFVKLQTNGLTEGQKHPLHQQFQSNETIPKLIQIFKNEKDIDILRHIAQILTYLFKSLPLPPEIRNKVIEKLKSKYIPDFHELSLLAECVDNHDSILANQFEMKLFKYGLRTLRCLNISLSILKYGSNINKLKVASVINQKVEQLTNDEYIDEFGIEYKSNWNSDKKQQIKSKAKELFQLIISIINDKNNINLISQLAAKIQDRREFTSIGLFHPPVQDSKDKDDRQYLCEIILNFVKLQTNGLTEGQKHPLHQQFQSNETIPKLIQIFKNEKDIDILRHIAQILTYLFKSLPLPPEIRNKVIEKLKSKYIPDFHELSLLAECVDNHDSILVNQFEMELFKYGLRTLECINISLSILKYGSNINKLKVASVINQKVEQLTNDEYVNQQYLISDQKQQIKSKAKELFQLIISIINDKNNINLISQLAAKIQDSKDKDDRQYLCEIILNFVKLQTNGLTEGQKHPLHQQFQSNETIPKLIQIFKNEKDIDILRHIAQILTYLFKSLPLPPEIKNDIIYKLKNYHLDFDELSLLAECVDNHDSILAKQFEMKLFQVEYYTLQYLNISLSILKYGSNINKLKVASVINQKVKQLTNDEYVNQQYWNEDKKQQIKSKSKELIPIILSII